MDAALHDRPDRLYAVRAVERVCSILRMLDGESGVGLAEVRKVTGLAKSSAFRYLAALEQEGFVERDWETGEYRLGITFLAMHPNHIESLATAALPLLEGLRDIVHETVNMGRLDRGRVTYLAVVESHRSIRLAARRGDRDRLHSTALGKAIAANLPASTVRMILESEGMPRFTDRTATDIDQYLGMLEQVRELGYALDDRENETEGRCVAVFVPTRGVPCAVSVSAIASGLPLADVPKVASMLTALSEKLAGKAKPVDHIVLPT